MQQGSHGEVPGRRVTGAASRFDRYGVRRGLPPAADPGYDEPDGGYGDEPDGAGYDDPYDSDEPPSWATDDGDLLALPAPVWAGWRRWGRPRRPRQGPWPSRRLDRVGRLVAGARRIGTARSRRTGERFPLYGSRIGTRSWRIVARPRGGRSREIVLVRPGAGETEEMEAFPLAASPGGRAGAAAAPGTTLDGYRLRLPHRGVHAVMARLEPDQLRDLAGGDLPADPASALVGSLARLARRARRAGTLRSHRSGQRLAVFRAPGYRILARPRGAREAEILLVRPVEGEEELVGPRDPGERHSARGARYRVRGARVRIEWQAGQRLSDLVGKKGVRGDVYVIVRAGGKPMYVGKTGNFSREWADRFHVLKVFGVPLEAYGIYLGTLRADPRQKVKKSGDRAEPWPVEDYDDGRHRAWLRSDVEQVLIRWLDRVGGFPLVNEESTRQIWVAPLGISVTHVNPPPFLRSFTLTAADSPFEVGPGQAPGA
jgi:hypothetical protein